jgi:uncharacterized protein YggE
MTDDLTRVSVHGEARRTVEPDLVRMPGSITRSAQHKAEALRDAAVAVDRFRADLAELGGEPLTTETVRHPLTWSVHTTSTSPDHEVDARTGQYRATGKVRAHVSLAITVRDLALLDRLAAVLAGHPDLGIQDAQWVVDPENPAWPVVRAAAVDDAVRQARDYAAALGGRLESVEHVADVGLLGGSGSDRAIVSANYMLEQSSSGGGFEPGEVPSLDPVPQTLVAGAEARFVATGMQVSSWAG